jgi:hypothetical protein
MSNELGRTWKLQWLILGFHCWYLEWHYFFRVLIIHTSFPSIFPFHTSLYLCSSLKRGIKWILLPLRWQSFENSVARYVST